MRRAPGLPELVFGVVLVLGLVGGHRAFLNDPGTFWHVELGRRTLAEGHVPRADMLTYTRPGVPWVDAAFGAEVLMAVVVDHLGWSGLVALSALIIAWTYRAVAQWLLEEGRSPWAAGLTAIVAAGVGACHFLARPHLATIAGTAYTLNVCRRAHRGEKVGALAFLPLVIGVWSTLHGGFIAGPLIIFTSAFGEAIAGPWDRARARGVGRFAAVGVMGLIAPMFGPYGTDIYGHITNLMATSGVTPLILEHQPTRLGDPDTRVLELVVMAFIALPAFTGVKISRFDLVHVLVWFHMGMSSVRHTPLFALAAAPPLAALIDAATSPSAVPAWLISRRAWWSACASALVVAAAWAGAPLGEFDEGRWPLATVAELDRQPVSARLFHDMDWGGLIAEQCDPRRPTFIDDRFELFGKEAVLAYMAALEGGPGWDDLDGREGFGLVWVRGDGPLARRLGGDRQWVEVARDRVSVLYRRVRDDRSTASLKDGDGLSDVAVEGLELEGPSERFQGVLSLPHP